MSASPATETSEQVLRSLILDYLRKRGLISAASALQDETQAFGEGPILSPPVDASGGFLAEWFGLFWDVFSQERRGVFSTARESPRTPSPKGSQDLPANHGPVQSSGNLGHPKLPQQNVPLPLALPPASSARLAASPPAPVSLPQANHGQVQSQQHPPQQPAIMQQIAPPYQQVQHPLGPPVRVDAPVHSHHHTTPAAAAEATLRGHQNRSAAAAAQLAAVAATMSRHDSDNGPPGPNHAPLPFPLPQRARPQSQMGAHTQSAGMHNMGKMDGIGNQSTTAALSSAAAAAAAQAHLHVQQSAWIGDGGNQVAAAGSSAPTPSALGNDAVQYSPEMTPGNPALTGRNIRANVSAYLNSSACNASAQISRAKKGWNVPAVDQGGLVASKTVDSVSERSLEDSLGPREEENGDEEPSSNSTTSTGKRRSNDGRTARQPNSSVTGQIRRSRPLVQKRPRMDTPATTEKAQSGQTMSTTLPNFDGGSLSQVDPVQVAAANAFASVLGVDFPNGAVPVQMTAQGLVYVHENQFKLWPGGQQLPFSEGMASFGTNNTSQRPPKQIVDIRKSGAVSQATGAANRSASARSAGNPPRGVKTPKASTDAAENGEDSPEFEEGRSSASSGAMSRAKSKKKAQTRAGGGRSNGPAQVSRHNNGAGSKVPMTKSVQETPRYDHQAHREEQQLLDIFNSSAGPQKSYQRGQGPGRGQGEETEHLRRMLIPGDGPQNRGGAITGGTAAGAASGMDLQSFLGDGGDDDVGEMLGFNGNMEPGGGGGLGPNGEEYMREGGPNGSGGGEGGLLHEISTGDPNVS